MKKNYVAILNTVLAFGVILILAGLFLIAHIFSDIEAHVPISSIAVIVIGAFTLYMALVKPINSLVFFTGLYLILLGSLYMFASSGVIPAGISELWPFSMILAGLSLLLTGLYRDRRIRFGFLFPSIVLAVLGAFFLLFSLEILPVTFHQILNTWWPLSLILIGGLLVILYAYLQSPANIFPKNTDENPDASDDENLSRDER